MISLLLAAAALPSALSPPAGADTSAIVVEGRRQHKRAIHDFVSALTPAHVGGQLSRFQAEVCPTAIGLTAVQNLAVAARMRAVAGAIGLPLAPARCNPNLLVVIVPDKEQFVADFAKRQPSYFEMPNNAAPVLRRERSTVAWHLTGMMTANHLTAPTRHDERGGHPYILISSDTSRLRPAGIPQFFAGVLVVDAAAVAGLTTIQFADYAAMRLFADSDPAKLKPTAPTILSVLDAPMGAPVPVTMTSWDLAFLKGLYRSDDRQFANRQRSEIEQTVDKAAMQTASDQ